MAASRFLATTLCKWTEQKSDRRGAPTGGLRRSPKTTKAARPHEVLLVDSSMIGYMTAHGKKVSLLRRMARSPSSVYVLNWSEMCEPRSWASWNKTALMAPHIAVASCVGRRQTNQQTNKQTNERTNERKNKRTNEQTNKKTDRQTDKQTNKQASKQANERTNEQTNGRTNEQANKRTNKKTEKQKNRKTERQRDRETERQRDRETERQRDRETERDRDTTRANVSSLVRDV